MNKSLFEPIVSFIDKALCLGLRREVADENITISQALILTFAPYTPHIAVPLIVVLTFLEFCCVHFFVLFVVFCVLFFHFDSIIACSLPDDNNRVRIIVVHSLKPTKLVCYRITTELCCSQSRLHVCIGIAPY